MAADTLMELKKAVKDFSYETGWPDAPKENTLLTGVLNRSPADASIFLESVKNNLTGWFETEQRSGAYDYHDMMGLGKNYNLTYRLLTRIDRIQKKLPRRNNTSNFGGVF